MEESVNQDIALPKLAILCTLLGICLASFDCLCYWCNLNEASIYMISHNEVIRFPTQWVYLILQSTRLFYKFTWKERQLSS